MQQTKVNETKEFYSSTRVLKEKNYLGLKTKNQGKILEFSKLIFFEEIFIKYATKCGVSISVKLPP